jgi:hypothetical protein
MRPDVDDLVVALAVGDDALAILLLDFGLICFWAASICSFSFGMIMSSMPMDTPDLVASRKPSSLSLSSMIDGLLVAGKLVAFPDQVAELGFLPDLVEKPSSGGQISLKITRPTVVSMIFLSASPKDGLAAEVGIGQAMRSCVFNAPSL